MKYGYYLILLFSLLLSSCSQEELSKSKVQSRLKNLQELGTVDYTLSKVLIVDDTQWYSAGDRKVIISMKANMKAGVDFSKLEIQEFDTEKKICYPGRMLVSCSRRCGRSSKNRKF